MRYDRAPTDPCDGSFDWVKELDVDLAAFREVGEPVLKLLLLGPLA